MTIEDLLRELWRSHATSHMYVPDERVDMPKWLFDRVVEYIKSREGDGTGLGDPIEWVSDVEIKTRIYGIRCTSDPFVSLFTRTKTGPRRFGAVTVDPETLAVTMLTPELQPPGWGISYDEGKTWFPTGRKQPRRIHEEAT